jgi:hypothetical protein
MVKQAMVPLYAGEGDTSEVFSEKVSSYKTRVERIRRHFVEEGSAVLEEKPRLSEVCKFDARWVARQMASCCTGLPEWTGGNAARHRPLRRERQ